MTPRRHPPYTLVRAFYGAKAQPPHAPGGMKFAQRHTDPDKVLGEVRANLADPEVGELTITVVGWTTA